jgi:predicted NBD/HSP70 family sugar kinase
MFHKTPSKRDGHAQALYRQVLLHGGRSRAELQRLTGLRSNTVIDVAEAMTEAGWTTWGRLPDGGSTDGGMRRGRPAVPLEIDRRRRAVVGIALSPQRVESAVLNLSGDVLHRPVLDGVNRESDLTRTAVAALRRARGRRTLAVGVSVTGLIDDDQERLLLSSSAPHQPGLSLAPLIHAAGELPLALDNDTHAMSDRWRLGHPDAAGETVLLIAVGDGRLGASIRPSGSPPDAGCVRGGNELGHVQVAPIPGHALPACFCGQPRCLERAVSSATVQRLTGRPDTLRDALRAGIEAPASDLGRAGRLLLDRLAEAVANAVNLIRPHRVVWADLDRTPCLTPAIAERLNLTTRSIILPALAHRVRFERWATGSPGTPPQAAIAAGHLAMMLLAGERPSLTAPLRLQRTAGRSAT